MHDHRPRRRSPRRPSRCEARADVDDLPVADARRRSRAGSRSSGSMESTRPPLSRSSRACPGRSVCVHASCPAVSGRSALRARRGPRGSGGRTERAGCAGPGDVPAVAEHRDPVRDLQREVDVLLGEQHRLAAVLQRPERVEDLVVHDRARAPRSARRAAAAAGWSPAPGRSRASAARRPTGCRCAGPALGSRGNSSKHAASDHAPRPRARAAICDVLADREAPEQAPALWHEADAEPRDLVTAVGRPGPGRPAGSPRRSAPAAVQPAIGRSRVVLPAPLRPSRTCTSLGVTARSSPCRTRGGLVAGVRARRPQEARFGQGRPPGRGGRAGSPRRVPAAIIAPVVEADHPVGQLERERQVVLDEQERHRARQALEDLPEPEPLDQRRARRRARRAAVAAARPTSAIAISSWRRSPCERLSHPAVARGRSSISCSITSSVSRASRPSPPTRGQQLHRDRPRAWAASMTFSTTVSDGKRLETWKVRAIPSRARRRADHAGDVRPSNRTRPASVRHLAGDQLEQRGLARAVRPDHRRAAPGRAEAQRDAVHGGQPAVPATTPSHLENTRAVPALPGRCRGGWTRRTERSVTSTAGVVPREDRLLEVLVRLHVPELALRPRSLHGHVPEARRRRVRSPR